MASQTFEPVVEEQCDGVVEEVPASQVDDFGDVSMDAPAGEEERGMEKPTGGAGMEMEKDDSGGAGSKKRMAGRVRGEWGAGGGRGSGRWNGGGGARGWGRFSGGGGGFAGRGWSVGWSGGRGRGQGRTTGGTGFNGTVFVNHFRKGRFNVRLTAGQVHRIFNNATSFGLNQELVTLGLPRWDSKCAVVKMGVTLGLAAGLKGVYGKPALMEYEHGTYTCPYDGVGKFNPGSQLEQHFIDAKVYSLAFESSWQKFWFFTGEDFRLPGADANLQNP